MQCSVATIGQKRTRGCGELSSGDGVAFWRLKCARKGYFEDCGAIFGMMSLRKITPFLATLKACDPFPVSQIHLTPFFCNCLPTGVVHLWSPLESHGLVGMGWACGSHTHTHTHAQGEEEEEEEEEEMRPIIVTTRHPHGAPRPTPVE